MFVFTEYERTKQFVMIRLPGLSIDEEAELSTLYVTVAVIEAS